MKSLPLAQANTSSLRICIAQLPLHNPTLNSLAIKAPFSTAPCRRGCRRLIDRLNSRLCKQFVTTKRDGETNRRRQTPSWMNKWHKGIGKSSMAARAQQIQKRGGQKRNFWGLPTHWFERLHLRPSWQAHDKTTALDKSPKPPYREKENSLRVYQRSGTTNSRYNRNEGRIEPHYMCGTETKQEVECISTAPD